MSSTGGSGAVFFLGTRAHYQVLQQPETRSYDMENGNESTETIYQNPSVQELWPEGQEANSNYINETNWNCYDNEVNVTDEKEKLAVGNGMKRRAKRRQSETVLCEKDGDMRPALLNDDGSTPKPKTRRLSMLSYLWSLARRRRRLEAEHEQNMRHLESALAACTYRESCRCLDCQSRYFECDESSDESSDDSDCSQYAVHTDRYAPPPAAVIVQQYDEDEDDEVFIDTIPGDNTSTDMLLDVKEPPAVHPTASASASTCTDEDADMQLEVAAGTPVLLNYLLTHPVTCAIQ